ncbi:MAG TPA: hypothetical protein VFZ61_29655 [Polyangiales bacterium]
MKRALVWLLPLVLTPAAARAGGTDSFVINSADAFEKGKLEGTAVLSEGKLTPALSTSRTAVEGAAVAYAAATGPDGAIYIGSGNEGNVLRVDASSQRVFAHADTPLVSALSWVGDTLYAGTLGKGVVLAIDRKGSVREFAKLSGAAHVWALAHDPKQNVLYAATGPEGKLFAIDAKGGAKLVHDDEAEHLLSLARDEQGVLYAGTSNGARLLRVAGKEVTVLYDAPGQELTALALGPGFVAIASNELSDTGDALKDAASRARRARTGKSKVFAVSFAGAVEELYRSDTAHVTALEVEPKSGAVHVGMGLEGRVVRAERGQRHAVWADADERQVIALQLNAASPYFVTSDGVAVYRVRKEKSERRWISAPLDAKSQARFGALHYRGKGKLALSTRAGNTETPDASWSDWSAALTQPGPIQSAAARFLQVRATLLEDAAELYAIEAFYLPQNQPAYVRNVRSSGSVEKPVPSPGLAPAGGAKSQLTLNWDVDNPDGDKLRYRLSYQREGQQVFLPLFPEHEVLEKNEYRWETLGVPDGHYRVKVEASDELATPAPAVTKSEVLSGPILIDNHAPRVELRIAGTRVSGVASDALGPVSLLELALDAGPYRPLAPLDGLLDSTEEKFELDLGALATGAHIVSVRVSDAARNTSTNTLEFAVKR